MDQGDACIESTVGAVKWNMIEIGPGPHVRQRDADENWRAIQDDFYAACICFACGLTLCWIQNDL